MGNQWISIVHVYVNFAENHSLAGAEETECGVAFLSFIINQQRLDLLLMSY